MNIMTIDEMRKHSWRVSWSGGKDSTATIILMHENNIPIEKIVYVRMMFNEEIPATLPVMTNFVDETIKKLEEWGYEVEVVKSKKSAFQISEQIYQRSKYSTSNGNKYGVSGFARGACVFQKEKPNAIDSVSAAEFEMIGYAADESERIHRLGGGRQSIMVTLGVSEKEAFEICTKYGMLSPLYERGIGRDGCFFCPNAGKKERELLKIEHPELVEAIYEMIGKTCTQATFRLRNRNNWIKDYFENEGKVSIPSVIDKDVLDGQMDIYDYIEEQNE